MVGAAFRAAGASAGGDGEGGDQSEAAGSGDAQGDQNQGERGAGKEGKEQWIGVNERALEPGYIHGNCWVWEFGLGCVYICILDAVCCMIHFASPRMRDMWSRRTI